MLYINLTCSIATPLNSSGKTWKMDISGPGKSWKITSSFLYARCMAAVFQFCLYQLRKSVIIATAVGGCHSIVIFLLGSAVSKFFREMVYR